MAKSFLRDVRQSFLDHGPTKADCVAHGTIRVTLGRKLVSALLEVGLREALAEHVGIVKLRLTSLKTVANRRAEVTAIADVKYGAVWNTRVTATIEVLPELGSGLKLHIIAITAVGDGWLDSLAASVGHWAALDDLKGSVQTIDDVKLTGARISKLSISESDPHEIIVEIRDAVATNAAFGVG